jgi:hypothetical protein
MSDEIKKIGEVALGPTIINPFSRKSIVSLYVSVDMINRRGKDVWIARGVVDFKEGNTSGRQSFQGDSFDEVVLQIKNFINNEL